MALNSFLCRISKNFLYFCEFLSQHNGKKLFFCVLATKKFPDGLNFFPRETFALFDLNFMSRYDFYQFFYTKLIKIELK
jgi:hypothetical protein